MKKQVNQKKHMAIVVIFCQIMVFALVQQISYGALGGSQSEAARSAMQILLADPVAPDGIYWIDPDGGDTANAFQVYCDMTTDGGGWMLAVNSVSGAEPSTNDMASNTGTPGLGSAHTRDMSYWAIDQDAEIRHEIIDNDNSLLFHAKYTGRYYDAMPTFGNWTTLSGHISGSEIMIEYHFGWLWTTTTDDNDGSSGNCAITYGAPWYYNNCWSILPSRPDDGLSQGPVRSGIGVIDRYSIWVRELVTPPLPGPVASLTAVPNPAGCGQSINFDGGDSYHESPIRVITTWEWDFDYDGITFHVDDTGEQVSHPFDQFGDYTVALRVTDDDSPPVQDVNTIIVSVSLGNHAPTADADGPYTIYQGEALVLDGTGSSDPDVSCGDYIISYAWDLDDDSYFDDATGHSPVVPWSTLNSLGLPLETENTIRLRVTDTFGGTGQDESSLTINVNSPPIVDAGLDQTVFEGDLVSLDPATFTDSDFGDTHTATINWGDTIIEAGIVNQEANSVSGSHVYADNGQYTVCIDVNDGQATGSDCLMVTVINMLPTVDTGQDQTIVLGDAFYLNATFNDKGTADTHAAYIDWGDGEIEDWSLDLVTESPFGPPGSTEGANGIVSASHEYFSSGMFTVTVRVADDEGGVDEDDLIVRVTKTIYVDADAQGSNDGSSWTDAYNYLQDALNNPSILYCNEILVANGTYYPDETTSDPSGTGDWTATFQLLNGVTIKGGYAGYGAADPNERNIQLYESILSGDINIPGDSSDNSYHVVTGSGTDETAILDSFTIIGGSANGSVFPDNCAGGMLNIEGSPTVTSCTFSGNSAQDSSGVMYNLQGTPVLTNCTFMSNWATTAGAIHNDSSSPSLTSCTFIGNSADYGGAMYNWNSNPIATNCAFSGNSASNSGGGMYNNISSPTLINCTFSDNSAGSNGGGMNNSNNSNPELTNCTFSRNSVTAGGGGMYNSTGCSPTLSNCTFSGNSAANGGGIRNWESNPSLTNCTFTRNSAGSNGGGMGNSFSSPTVTNCILWGDNPDEILNYDSTPTVTYSDVQGGCPGEGNIDVDPLFVDSNGPDGIPETADDEEGYVHLRGYSPCINAGDPNGDYNGHVDIDNQPRVAYGRVDMGADEVFPIAGDVEPDGDVDFGDFAYFAEHWLAGK